MKDLVKKISHLILDKNTPPYDNIDLILVRRYEIKFGTVLLSRPAMTEGDGSTSVMLPQEARLRNLTYSSPLYLEMTKRTLVARERAAQPDEYEDEEAARIDGEDQNTAT